ncbi:MAG TPA: hypothetical protein PL011_09560, partial [Kiritimatiellia bacterium]|nr:hypothetical protein [Kiritimatiellia bacterium]
ILHRVIGRSWRNEAVHLVTKGDSSPRDVVQPSENTVCLGRLTGFTYKDRDYDLRRWFWRPVNVAVAGLSAFCARCRRSFLFREQERPYRDQRLPQKAAILLIRCLIYPAKWLSGHPVSM